MRGLRYEPQPDYNHWKQTFQMFAIRLAPPSDGSFDLASSSSSHMNTQQVQLAALQEWDLSANRSETEPPMVKGQYVLVQILPHLTIKGTPLGRSNDSVNKSC